MTSPLINSFSSYTYTSGYNNDRTILAMTGSTLISLSINNTVLAVLGPSSTNFSGFAGMPISGKTASGLSITPDASIGVIFYNDNSGTPPGAVIQKVNLVSGNIIGTYTNGNASPSTQGWVGISAVVYCQDSNTYYAVENNTSASTPYVNSVFKIVISGSTYTTSRWCQSLGVGSQFANSSNCIRMGNSFYFSSFDLTTNYYKLFTCSATSSDSTPSSVSGISTQYTYAGNGIGLAGIPAVLGATGLYTDFIFMTKSNGVLIDQYAISGETATKVSTYNVGGFLYSYDIAGSNAGGNTPGNMRLFVSLNEYNPGYGVMKLYNTDSGNGPTGVSTGGDPHTTTLTGKSIIIVRDEPFLYLDTHPEGMRDGDLRTYITCDCFSLKCDVDHFADKLPPKHVEELITNLDDSYLKYLNISLSSSGSLSTEISALTESVPPFSENSLSLKLEMISLLLPDEGEAGGLGREQTNCGRERVFTTSDEKGRIEFSAIEFFEPGSRDIKSKYARSRAFCKREVRIYGREYVLKFQITRTSCIHLSDVYLEIDGRRDPFTFGGVVVDGDVTTPEY